MGVAISAAGQALPPAVPMREHVVHPFHTTVVRAERPGDVGCAT